MTHRGPCQPLPCWDSVILGLQGFGLRAVHVSGVAEGVVLWGGLLKTCLNVQKMRMFRCRAGWSWQEPGGTVPQFPCPWLCCPPGPGTPRMELGRGGSAHSKQHQGRPTFSSPTMGTPVATGPGQPMPEHLCPCCHRCPRSPAAPPPCPHFPTPLPRDPLKHRSRSTHPRKTP